MLDRMRRHRNWLNWSLVLVVLAFIVFYIPDFLRGPEADVQATDTIAVVDGHAIRADEFQRLYQAQVQAYRSAYGGNVNEQLLKQLGIEQQILQQMVDSRAAVVEADRLGINVSDEEVRQRILSIPSLQENGAFIGEVRYQQLLASQQPPVSVSDFEQSLRESLQIEKLRLALTEWMSVPDAELVQEYRKRNDKVKLAVVALTTESVSSQITATDAEVEAYFEGHKETFRVPEKRKIRYVLVDVDAMRAKITPTQADIDAAYNDNIQQYSTPEQIRASHILLKTEGKDDAAVKAKAEDLVRQARGGADFAALAKSNSEDEGTVQNGGDLDYFSRGRMVPEFETAAFGIEKPGDVAGPIKTAFGYHVIKLVDRKPAVVKPLDEVKQQLTEQITTERAQTQAADLADRLATQITKPADLDTAARANGLTVQESGFFAANEPILSLGASPQAASTAFSLADGEVSGPIQIARGIVFEAVSGKQPSYLPKLEEVKEKVRDDVVKEKALALTKQKAADLVARLKSAPDFDRAAKAAGVEPKTTELMTREMPLPDIGQAPQVTEAAFKLAPGAVSDPISTDLGTVIVKVLEKNEVSDADLAQNKESFRGQLLSDRRNRFFSAYMVKAKQKMKIELNRTALQRVTG
jgi:peptidyl-prolyl cis-trans isomerase D